MVGRFTHKLKPTGDLNYFDREIILLVPFLRQLNGSSHIVFFEFGFKYILQAGPDLFKGNRLRRSKDEAFNMLC